MKETLLRILPALTDEQRDRFCRYYELLADWNTRMNLTAIVEKTDVARKHFADSLAAEPYLPANACVIDVGTGAGFPGIPLLIVRPDLKLTLLDGLNKRLLFLQAVLDELGLSATCVHMRAEDAGRDPRFRAKFDVSTTRAVASLPVLAELTLPFVKVCGVSIAYKGDAREELASAEHALNVLHADASLVDVSSVCGVRTLVMMRKTAPTPKQYPRKAGTPAKQPL